MAKGSKREAKVTGGPRDISGTSTAATAGTALPKAPLRRPHRDRRGIARPRAPGFEFDPPPHRPAGAMALAIPQPQLKPAVADPRTLDGSPLVLPPRIGKIDHEFLRTELPRLNNAVSRGDIALGVFVESIRGRLSALDLEAVVRIGERHDPHSANYVLGVLGAIGSSVVRHERLASGHKDSSAGLSLIPGLEPALIAFGNIAKRAPRDNHDTTWVLGFPQTFTGSGGEQRFGRAVREANRLLGASERILMPIRTGDLALIDASEQLLQAAAYVSEYGLVQSDLAIKSFPAEFLAMRDYLGKYKVGGEVYEGPNATYSGGWTGFEVALGLLEGYRSTALDRTRHMSIDDRRHVETSCELPTLCELVAVELGLPEIELANVDPKVLGDRVAASPLAVRTAISAVRRLAKDTAVMAGTHWGAINKNLIAPVSQMSDEERIRLGVPPTGGVSGTALEHTFSQRTKRLAHPLIRMRLTGIEEDEK